MTKEQQALAYFYRTCARKIGKSKLGYITLPEAETVAGHKYCHMAYSWMQWPIAKEWFEAGIVGDDIAYYLKSFYRGSHVEAVRSINEYFK